MNRVYQISIILLLIVVGFLWWHGQKSELVPGTGVQKKDVEAYNLLSRRVLQEYHNDILINFLPLRKKLNEIVVPYDDSFALYFEYLPTGTSIGINANAEFSLASLIKLPVVMAYYHRRERLHQQDDQEVTIIEDDLDPKFGTLWKKGAGTKIRLSEAVRLAITESDNTAARVVARQVPDEDFDAVYEGLDIELKTGEVGAIITAREYTSILKALYFASILTKDDSQELLTILTKTKFTNKIPAGVGKGVLVAHKVGILGSALYSDCAIVYVPKRPYMLCMISATDEETASKRMREISKEVYDFVVQANK